MPFQSWFQLVPLATWRTRRRLCAGWRRRRWPPWAMRTPPTRYSPLCFVRWISPRRLGRRRGCWSLRCTCCRVRQGPVHSHHLNHAPLTRLYYRSPPINNNKKQNIRYFPLGPSRDFECENCVSCCAQRRTLGVQGGGTDPTGVGRSPATAGSQSLTAWVTRVAPLTSDRHAPLRAAAAAGLAVGGLGCAHG